jgi:putative membrane protein
MWIANVSLTSFFALALAVSACGGSDENMHPENPSTTTTTSGTSTSGATPSSGYGTPPSNYGAPETTTPTPEQQRSAAESSSMMTSPTATTPGTSAAQASATSDTTPLTDARILGVVDTANLGEIDQARIAQTKATEKRVKELAQHMLADHQKAEQAQRDIAKKQQIVPEESDTSRSLQNGGVQTMATLRAAPGSSFDKSYVDAQVTEHTDLLKMLDDDLIPHAQNADLKAHLRSLRVTVASHLRMATDLRDSLK